jgi:hypothetical protein
MSLVIPNEGDRQLLRYMLNVAVPNDVVLRLFTNVITPAKTDTLAMYTECASAGYAPISLLAGSWSINTIGITTTGTYPMQGFNITVGATLQGYYVTNSTNTILLWAELFSPAFVLPGGGGTVFVTPTITLN